MRKCKFCNEPLKWYEGWFSGVHSMCEYISDFKQFRKLMLGVMK